MDTTNFQITNNKNAHKECTSSFYTRFWTHKKMCNYYYELRRVPLNKTRMTGRHVFNESPPPQSLPKWKCYVICTKAMYGDTGCSLPQFVMPSYAHF